MRKNGINRELTPIAGGVCAPAGFKANAVACGIRYEGGLDFGMIFSPKRCSVGCVYATGNHVGAPVTVSKKNMRNGYIRAILVNGGIANTVEPNGEELALSVCDLLFPYGIERTEIVVASTGYIGKSLHVSPFAQGIKPLYEGLNASAENSGKVAQAIASPNAVARELAFSFDLGEYPCKIGMVFKGGAYTAPNMATFLAFLTTDVNIATPMLQRALAAEVRETLNMLNIGGTPSPNDTVCIMANGQAGNYRIDSVDSEYKKFTIALRAALTELCKITVKEGAKQVLTCRVSGAKSKEICRTAAKTIVGSEWVKSCIERKEVEVESIFYALLSSASILERERVCIRLRSCEGEVALFENGRTLTPMKETLVKILNADEVEIDVRLHTGNYQALAFGRI